MMMRILHALFAICICIGYAHSQENIVGELVQSNGEYEILDANIEHYDIYRIQLKRSDISTVASSFLLDLQLGEKKYNLNLYKGNLTTSFDHPEKPYLLGGSLNTGGVVSLTINDDFIFGFIKDGGNKIYIEPLRLIERGAPNDLFVVYDVDDVINTGEHVCGADHVDAKTPKLPENMLKMPTTTCKVVDYAIANTFNMIAAHGSTTGVMNFNTAVLNDVQSNYRSEFDSNLEYDVVATYTASSTATNPFDPNPVTTNGSTMLSNFRRWAQGPGNAGGGNTGGATGGFGIDYNMAGVWTDTNFSGGVVGIAYTPGWHHILENYTANSASLQAMVSHEIGHNWNALHDGSNTNFIMAPSVTLTGNWSAASKSAINSRVASQTYLAACSTLGVPVANFFQSAIGACSGNSIDFEDQSQYGATRAWDFPSGSPLTSTSEKPSILYNTNGLYGVSITSTNGAGSDTDLKYVDIESAPPSPCTPTGSSGTQGINRVRVSNLDNPTTTGTIYQNFGCSGMSANLDESTAYTMRIGVTGVSRIRYFVDYNDDGDFTDSGEASSQFNFSGNGTLQLTLNTPATVTTEELLRFRVIVSTSNISNTGCTTPSVGEVEDYAFYFNEAQVYGCTDPAASNYDPAATIDDGSCTYGSMTWYEDSDTDTYGNPNVSQQSTTQPPGFVLDDTDCDDTDGAINPGATEVCDGVDNNCDGNIDEGLLTTFYLDSDNDSYGNPNVSTDACTQPAGYVSNNLDCDDSDDLEFPGQQWFRDADGDQHGDATNVIQCTRPVNYYVSQELISVDLDCDDFEANAYPGNTEVCDGIDNDCDGNIDEGTMTTYYKDSDNDSFGNPNDFMQGCSQPPSYVLDNTDCDDSDDLEFPGQTWYKDVDGDLYGDGTSIVQCLRPTNYYVAAELTATSTDCDDNNASVNPGAAEVCADAIDNNCNGQVDEGCVIPDCDDTILVIPNITQNTYRAELSIESDALANNGQSILFTAGNSLELNGGFEVEAGTPFEASIDPCDNSFNDPENDEVSKIINIDEIKDIATGLEDLGLNNNILIETLDKWGQLVLFSKTDLESFESTLEWMGSKLESGSYIIVVSDDNNKKLFTYNK